MLASLVLLVFASGCSCGDRRGSDRVGQSLLARGPDEVLDQVGRLAADDDAWVEAAFDGWILEDGVAWTTVGIGRVSIGALRAESRTVHLDLVGREQEQAAAQTYTVRLNGEPVGSGEVAPGRFQVAVDVPGPLWERGPNTLEIEVEPLSQVAPKEWRGIGVLEIVYDEARAVRCGPAGANLGAGTGLRYRLSPGDGALLFLDGESKATGDLHVVLGWMSPRNGDVEKPIPGSRIIRCESGRCGGVVPLPGADGRVLDVEIAWSPDDGSSSLDLTEVALADPSKERRPNVVYISIDTLSAKHMSVYGYPRRTTPNLERFAQEAIAFDSCKSPAPWTIPSYMSQFTGLYPRANRMSTPRTNPWEVEQIAPNRWTLAEALRAAGYATAGFVDNPWLGKGFGFRQGFEHYDTSAADVDIKDPTGGFRLATETALRWIDSRKDDRPVFLFVQGFDPHAPYVTQAPWKGSFAEAPGVDRERMARTGHFPSFTWDVVPAHIAWFLFGPPMPQEVPTAPIIDAYDEKILETDAAIGYLLDELATRGIYDDAVILVSADHGESMIEHGQYFNHGLLYEEHLHVPLLVRLPGGERGGTRVSDPVQLTDLYPSLVELLEIPLDCESLHGTARVLDHLRGHEPRSKAPVFAEGWLMDQLSIEEDGWKLILVRPLVASIYVRFTSPYVDRDELVRMIPELSDDSISEMRMEELISESPEALRYLRETLDKPRPHLFYLPDDPQEQNDVAERHPEIVRALTAKLAEQTESWLESAASARFTSTRTELTAAEAEEMKALGYTGD